MRFVWSSRNLMELIASFAPMTFKDDLYFAELRRLCS